MKQLLLFDSAPKDRNCSPVGVERLVGSRSTQARTHLDLFSGIGGFALAARWAGLKTVAFCEIEDFSRRVLSKNFPGIPIHKDIRELEGSKYEGIGIITGGFPCQNISRAGTGAGLSGHRSSLWSEMFRVIGEVRPKWVIIENASSLRGNGLASILQDLWTLGFDAEWHIISAACVGASHQRERTWIIANSDGGGCEAARITESLGKVFAGETYKQLPPAESGRFLGREGWVPEPRMDRITDDVPGRMGEISGYGNAIVPQVAYEILRCI